MDSAQAENQHNPNCCNYSIHIIPFRHMAVLIKSCVLCITDTRESKKHGQTVAISNTTCEQIKSMTILLDGTFHEEKKIK